MSVNTTVKQEVTIVYQGLPFRMKYWCRENGPPMPVSNGRTPFGRWQRYVQVLNALISVRGL